MGQLFNRYVSHYQRVALFQNKVYLKIKWFMIIFLFTRTILGVYRYTPFSDTPKREMLVEDLNFHPLVHHHFENVHLGYTGKNRIFRHIHS